MKWREPKEGETMTWITGTPTRGGEVYLYADNSYQWGAWARDAYSRAEPGFKTLKAAQKAVERWLGKHS